MMPSSRPLRVVLVKPSKYGVDGIVERFRRGFMPNSTLPHIASMTPPTISGRTVTVHAIDEYVETDLDYLRLLESDAGADTVLAIVGVQSHQLHRALDHLRTLRTLAPDVASFYILTPIPGTEQYDEFLAQGLITETNLDRFDATHPTWSHPQLTHAQLTDLLYRCYRDFYAWPDALAKSARWFWKKRTSDNILLKVAVGAYSFLSRVAAARRTVPMSGGLHRVRLDGAADYLPLRRRVFDVELVPLPRSLAHSRQPSNLQARSA